MKKFLKYQDWHPGLNRNQLREKMRRNLTDSDMMRYGIDHLVDSAVNAKSNTSFYPKIDEVVTEFLGLNEPPPVKSDEDMNTDDQESRDKPVELPAGDDDRQEVDMDVDSNDSNSGSTSAPGFIQSFKEIEAPQMSPGFSIPTETVTSEQSCDAQMAPSTAAPTTPIPKKPFTMQIALRDETAAHIEATDGLKFEQPIIKLEETTIPEQLLSETRLPQEAELPSVDKIKSEPTEPPTVVKAKSEDSRSQSPKEMKPAPLTEKKRLEIIARVRSDSSRSPFDHKQAKLKKELKTQARDKHSDRKPNISSTGKQVKSAPASGKRRDSNDNKQVAAKVKKEKKKKEEDDLSDVSSVHTSDLSDYDDRISISSGDEDAKKVLTLEEGRKLTTEKQVTVKTDGEAKDQAPVEKKRRPRVPAQQRYDASDLYKPRPTIGSGSRRSRKNASDD